MLSQLAVFYTMYICEVHGDTFNEEGICSPEDSSEPVVTDDHPSNNGIAVWNVLVQYLSS